MSVETVTVIVGDTDVVKVGGGSHSGRSMRMAGTVIVKAAEALIQKGKKLAALVFEAAETDIDFRDGVFAITGTDREIPDLCTRAGAGGSIRSAGGSVRRIVGNRGQYHGNASVSERLPYL